MRFSKSDVVAKMFSGSDVLAEAGSIHFRIDIDLNLFQFKNQLFIQQVPTLSELKVSLSSRFR